MTGHSPLRLLAVVPAYEPAWAFGGVVRSVSNMCRALARLGVDVSVYTTNADGRGGCVPAPVSQPVSVDGVTVTYFPSSFGPAPAWASRQMRHRLEETVAGFDIVYIAAIWQWIGICACRIARQRHIPHIVSPDGSFLPPALRYRRLKKLVFWHSFLGRCVAGANAIRFTTEYERRCSRSFLSRKASFLVPNPVVIDNRHAGARDSDVEVRRRWGIPEDSLLLLAVTRAHPNKRLDVAIEALSVVRRSHPDARLLVVGPFENGYGGKLRTLAAGLNVSDAVIWAGYQDADSLEAFYRAGDLFVLPSAHENFCLAAAEAMAHGLPIIISRHMGIAEDVQRHGAGIVTEVDAGQIADAILALADPEKRREMGTKARDMTTQLYNGERVARLVLRAFEDILSGTRSPECAWQ